jgi:hypothetical protein
MAMFSATSRPQKECPQRPEPGGRKNNGGGGFCYLLIRYVRSPPSGHRANVERTGLRAHAKAVLRAVRRASVEG